MAAVAVDGVVLDSGALTALSQKNSVFRVALHRLLRGVAQEVALPTAVIAEATTGDHRLDVNVNRTLKSTVLVTLDPALARAAAVLRHAHRRRGAGTIDAIVVATADVVPGTRLLTSDADDLRLLASRNNRTKIVPVA